MKKIVTCSEMKQLDQHTIQNMGVPSLVLMERAALSVADHLKSVLKKTDHILVVCGGGNNGADGIAIARLLTCSGYSADILLDPYASRFSDENRIQKQIAENYQVTFLNASLDTLDLSAYTVIVDAIFGIGINRKLKEESISLLEKLNASSAYKVAVDIPSGISGDTGQILGNAFHADTTVAFAYKKAGMFLYPGKLYCGKILTADIGIYADDSKNTSKSFSIEECDLHHLTKRKEDGNKGTFGKVLSVSGSKGMSGASYFCSRSSLVAGCGMVKIHTSEHNRMVLQTLLPEAMVSVEFDESSMMNNLNWSDTILIGPGIGTSKESLKTLEWYLKNRKKEQAVVLDADALNLIANDNSDTLMNLIYDSPTVLTPHLGEFSRLTGKTISEIKADLAHLAQTFAMEHKIVLVLKDACTITALPDGTVYYNQSGSSAMATAGSGDVLAGFLAGILAKHRNSDIYYGRLAAEAVFVHGLAGELAAETCGADSTMASDLIEQLKEVLKRLEGMR